MHTITGDAIELSRNFDPSIREARAGMGYRIEIPDEVAGAAHGAEILRDTGEVRSGGNTWAAGV